MLPIFGDAKDALLFKRAYDSLKVVYPKSPYIVALLEEVRSRENILIMNDKLSEAPELGYPDISLPDLNSKVRSLSDLQGKAVILYFWSSEDVKQKMFNKELVELYSKYNKKGLEIFQVCVDADKTSWATSVATQKLPWINVCDGLGANSAAVRTYNIQNVPSLFVISKEGEIVARDLSGKKLDALINKLVK